MVDLSNVDLVALIEREAGMSFGKAYGIGAKRTAKGSCPWCGGTDRFAVFVGDEHQHYHCGVNSSGCDAHGDAITFLREFCNMSFHEACDYLDVDPESYFSGGKHLRAWSPALPPNAIWQQSAGAFVQYCQQLLWGEQGKAALDYLKGRGLTEDTIKAARLGYSPCWVTEGELSELETWGFTKDIDLAAKGKHTFAPDRESIKLPSGIVIPHVVGGVLWKVNIRRLQFYSWETPDDRKKRKYRAIDGSASCLYNADAIQPGAPLLMAESELDALSAQQASDIACVATGGASGARGLQWTTDIALASHILVAFDKDEQQQGLIAAREWLKVLKDKAVIWQPTGKAKDINDMLVQGQDIQAWVELGLSMFDMPLSVEPDPVEIPQQNGHKPDVPDIQDMPRLEPATMPSSFQVELAALRAEIGRLAREEANRWEYSTTELDPRWPPSAKIYKRIRLKSS